MGITLPNSGEQPLPDVPKGIKDEDLRRYLTSLKIAVERRFREQFTNTLLVSTTVNLGTSGTFVISSGGSIIVTSGIVIKVTS